MSQPEPPTEQQLDEIAGPADATSPGSWGIYEYGTDGSVTDATAEVRRLRAELAATEMLAPQQCPAGLHADWLVDSEYAHACPWCEIDRLRTVAASAPPAAPPGASQPSSVSESAQSPTRAPEGALRGSQAPGIPQPVEDLAAADNPTHLRWGLNDVQWCDDDSVIVMLSGPDREAYWLELDPERAAVLREDLAGPAEDPAPAEDFTGTQPCGHDDYHSPHPWADRPNVWCPSHSHDDDQPATSEEQQ